MVTDFQTAELTSDQYTKVRGNHTDKWFVILNPNTVVFKARVNQTSFDDSFAQVTYDTVTTGAYTDIVQDQVVLISHTDDQRAAFFRGRVRKTPTSSILYINETSLAVTDNDFIWVIQDWQLSEYTPHKDETTGEILMDWDKPFAQLPPLVRGVPHVIYGVLSGGVLDIAFAPTALATTSGTSISSWANSAPGADSYQSGSSSAQNFTLRYVTAGQYYVRIAATDAGGRVGWFVCKVLVNDDTNSIVAKGIEISTIGNSVGDGLSTQLTVRSGSDVATVLDQTEVYIVNAEIFGDDTTTPIVGNVLFVGRLKGQDDRVRMTREAGRTSSVTFEVEGLGAQMGRLILSSIAMRRITAAAVFGEVAALTLWRGLTLVFTQLTNLGSLAEITFSDETSSYGVPLLGTETRSVGDTTQEISFAINAFANFAPSGGVHIARHIQYLSSTDKAALIVAAHLTLQDIGGNADLISIKRDHILKIGRIIGFGGSYNTSSGDVTALRAIAPARVFSSGAGRSQFNSQVLPINLTLAQMQDEIALRTGADYAAKNQVVALTADLPGAYLFLRPSVFQRWTWTLAANVTKTGRAYTTDDDWWLESATLTHYHEESRTSVQGRWILDTENISAKVIAEIAPEDVPYSAPTFVPYPASPFPMLDSLKFPDGANVAPEDEQPFTADEVLRATSPGRQNTDPDRQTATQDTPEAQQGSIVLCGNAGGVWITEKFTKSGNPTWFNITPATGMKRACFNEFGGGLYALSYDGVDSYVWRAANALNPSWLAGAALEDKEFTQLAVRNAPGVVYALAQVSAAPVTYTDDLNAGLGANSHELSATYPFAIYNGLVPSRDGEVGGVWIATDGRTGGGSIQGADVSVNNNIAAIAIDLGAEYTITAVSFWVKYKPLSPGAATNYVTFWDDTKTSIVENSVGVTGGVNTYHQESWSGSQAGVRYVSINALINLTPNTDAYLDDIEVTYVNDSGIGTVYSVNLGATFAAAVVAGVDPGGVAGFASQPGGSAVYVGASAKVVQAASGGSYSDTTGGGTTGTYPIAIAPYGSSFYLASAAAVSGETLWRVVGGVPTAITPNDGSNDGLVVGPGALCISPTDDQCIFAICNFGGTLKLARSTNGGSSWSITSGLASGASWVRAKNNNQVYIANGNSLLYSEDGGATLIAKAAPGPSLLYVEVA